MKILIAFLDLAFDCFCLTIETSYPSGNGVLNRFNPVNKPVASGWRFSGRSSPTRLVVTVANVSHKATSSSHRR